MKKTNKLLTVSVGIPAFNEEINIKNIIENILSQNQTNFRLEKIIVTSDQSTDSTDDIVKSFKNKNVVLIRNKQRVGTALSQNIIAEENRSDILVLLDADVLPTPKVFLSNFIKNFYVDEKAGLIGARVVPLEGQNFLENILNFSVQMKQEISEKFNSGDNIFLCHGRARAFRRQLLSKFKWVPLAGEDAFSYLQCKLNGFTFHFQPEAIVYYRSPQTLKDHFKQSIRYFNGRKALEEYFSKIILFKNFSPPRSIIALTMMKYLLKNPLYFAGYIGMLVYSKLSSFTVNLGQSAWDMSTSSKKLT